MTVHAITAALALAESGVPVFPCLASKAPSCPGGFKAATTNPVAVRELWTRHPGPLVGVPTGAISGIDVVDIDPRNGGDRWLVDNSDRLPVTRIHATRSGGDHLLFRHHVGLGCSAGRVAPGIDIRAVGGYIIWWPAADIPVRDESPIAAWPEWLLPLALPPVRPPLPDRPTITLTGTRAEKYALGALRNAADRVASAGEGSRNATLNVQTYNLTRRFGAVLGLQRIADVMAAAGLSAGLSQTEVVRTLESALRAGGGE